MKKIKEDGLSRSTHYFLFAKIIEDPDILKQYMDHLKSKQEELKEIAKSSESIMM